MHDAHPGEHRDEGDDHHQLDEREPGGGAAGRGVSQHRAYQSLYFVPSSAVAPLLVNTSNTLCPPQVVASGAS